MKKNRILKSRTGKLYTDVRRNVNKSLDTKMSMSNYYYHIGLIACGLESTDGKMMVFFSNSNYGTLKYKFAYKSEIRWMDGFAFRNEE